MKGHQASCRIRPNVLGDWQILPPPGQITQIGDAGVTAWGLVANDDFFVSGSMEVRNLLYVGGQSQFDDDLLIRSTANLTFKGTQEAALFWSRVTSEITIPVGQGVAGISGGANFAQANSILMAVVARVTQAPGGGAVNWKCGRPANLDEFMQAVAVALGTTATSAADGDGVNAGPVHNDVDDDIVVSTNANVTISDMKVRVTVFYIRMDPPES